MAKSIDFFQQARWSRAVLGSRRIFRVGKSARFCGVSGGKWKAFFEVNISKNVYDESDAYFELINSLITVKKNCKEILYLHGFRFPRFRVYYSTNENTLRLIRS